LNTKIIKQVGMSVLALGVIFALGACSSKPSPWSQQASPWDNRQGSEQEVAADQMEAEPQSPFSSDAEMTESSGIAEPVAEEAIMEEPVATEAEEMAMAELEPEPEPMMEEPEPMMEATVVGGDLNSQPPGHFAVQVVASSNMENLKAFAQRNQLSDEWVAETSVNGKTWFVLLQGVYPTMSEAKAALEQVSATLDTSPWVRSVGSLQSVMIQ